MFPVQHEVVNKKMLITDTEWSYHVKTTMYRKSIPQISKYESSYIQVLGL